MYLHPFVFDDFGGTNEGLAPLYLIILGGWKSHHWIPDTSISSPPAVATGVTPFGTSYTMMSLNLMLPEKNHFSRQNRHQAWCSPSPSALQARHVWGGQRWGHPCPQAGRLKPRRGSWRRRGWWAQTQWKGRGRPGCQRDQLPGLNNFRI